MIHDTISRAGGIRPLAFTCSSMTSAGVIITPYFIMSSIFSTFSTSTPIPATATAFCVSA